MHVTYMMCWSMAAPTISMNTINPSTDPCCSAHAPSFISFEAILISSILLFNCSLNIRFTLVDIRWILYPFEGVPVPFLEALIPDPSVVDLKSYEYLERQGNVFVLFSVLGFGRKKVALRL